MKTDSDLKRDVEAELAWDPAVRSSVIGVAVKDGVVTLTGHLETYSEKWAVEKALRRIKGVKAIALEMDVRLAQDHRRSDTEIAQAAELALQWHALVPSEAVRVIVEKGWITLQGELDWDFQRQSVEHAVRHLKGVTGVSNEINLRFRPAPAEIGRRIADALKRQVDREVDQLDVRIQGDTVTLHGTVHSWHERDAAEGVARSAPGVRHVVNELRLG